MELPTSKPKCPSGVACRCDWEHFDTTTGARDVPARSSHEAANNTILFARPSVQRAAGRGRPALRFSPNRGLTAILGFSALVLLSFFFSGCVTKATADAQARAAFLAGQQQALERMQQTQGRANTVTFLGEVKNNLIPWTADLTLSRAIVAAGYFGSADPKEIVVNRDGQEMRIDPKQLLGGNDILMMPRDVVEFRH
jgi:hypothetical protein